MAFNEQQAETSESPWQHWAGIWLRISLRCDVRVDWFDGFFVIKMWEVFLLAIFSLRIKFTFFLPRTIIYSTKKKYMELIY